MFNDGFVVVSIDTYNNYQKGLVFAVNPYGIQGDLKNNLWYKPKTNSIMPGAEGN
jgi:hypothetical protein